MFMRKAIHYFLYAVPSMDELPAPVADAIRQHVPEEYIQTILVIPPQDYAVHRDDNWKKRLPFGWRTTPQRTLVFGQHQIVLVEAGKDGAISTQVIPLDCLVYVTLSTILLYATLELAWVNGQQIEKRLIEYNAVGERIVRRQVEWTRTQISARISPAAAAPEGSISHLPFKFHNYLKYSLLADERLLAAVHQPAVRREGRMQPYLSPNRTIALTDRFLLILEEQERRRKSTYGIVTRFCPLDRVQRVSFRSVDELCWMQLELGAGGAVEPFEIPLEADNGALMRVVWDTLRLVPA